MATIEYQVYQRGLGWGTIAKDSKVCGQVDGPDICAIRIKAMQDDEPISVTYAVKQEGMGWSAACQNWDVAGQENGPRIDKIKVSVEAGHQVHYGVYAPGVGWLTNRTQFAFWNFTSGSEYAGSDNCWMRAIYVLLLPG